MSDSELGTSDRWLDVNLIVMVGLDVGITESLTRRPFFLRVKLCCVM